MRLLAFQHVAGEHPAAFADLAAEAGDAITIVRLDPGGALPDAAKYDALQVMGGPMDVWDTAAHPWLAEELAYIGAWVRADRPFLGICLGHQLLATAMGGRCAPMAAPQIGVSTIKAALPGLPETLDALHWHGVEVTQLPDGATVLARDESCAVQALRIRHAIGVQFHPELLPGLVTGWLEDPANRACATGWLGSEQAARDFAAAAEAQVPAARQQSSALYHWLATSARRKT